MITPYIISHIQIEKDHIIYQYSFFSDDYYEDGSLKIEVLKDFLLCAKNLIETPPPETIYDHPLKEAELTPLFRSIFKYTLMAYCQNLQWEGYFFFRWVSFPDPVYLEEVKEYEQMCRDEAEYEKNEKEWFDNMEKREKEEKLMRESIQEIHDMCRFD
jgi:hypothetical protein